MAGGTLLVSRYTNWLPHFKMRLEALGFPDVHVTDTEKDGLNMLINEINPGYVLIGSNFYSCGTPYMMGQLLSVFPKLNVAISTTSPFPDGIATWFIFHGIKTYIKLSDGKDEFHYGLQCILDGKKYIAPDVRKIIEELPEWPDVLLKTSKRQKEVLLMLCCGFSIKEIENCLQIGKVTVEYHIRDLKKVFNCGGREELIMIAHCLDIFTKNDLCFYGTDYHKNKIPDWAKAQQNINGMRRIYVNQK
jgi:DNA-binding NarL/FixJ family response regulator